MVSLHPACCFSQHLLLSGVKNDVLGTHFYFFFFKKNLTVSLFHLIPEGGPTGHRALDWQLFLLVLGDTAFLPCAVRGGQLVLIPCCFRNVHFGFDDQWWWCVRWNFCVCPFGVYWELKVLMGLIKFGEFCHIKWVLEFQMFSVLELLLGAFSNEKTILVYVCVCSVYVCLDMCLHVRVCVYYGMCKGQGGTLAFHFESCLLCLPLHCVL